MAPQATTTFNLLACALVVDGEIITGWSDGDLLTVERFSDAGGYREGSDGLGMFVHNPSKSYNVTARVQGNSRGYRKLTERYAAAEAAMDAGGAHPIFDGSARDPLHGSSITSPQIFFQPGAYLPAWQADGLGVVEIPMVWTNAVLERGTLIV